MGQQSSDSALKILSTFRTKIEDSLLSVFVANENEEYRGEDDHEVRCRNLASHGKEYFEIFDGHDDSVDECHDDNGDAIMVLAGNLRIHYCEILVWISL